MPSRRSASSIVVARSIWYTAPGKVELKAQPLPRLHDGEVRVRSLYSGISRGTERLVAAGRVGLGEWERMRAPFQDGQFPFPVKYGYCAVGIVEAGPAELLAKTVFCLHPHQDVFHVPSERVTVVPSDVPARRATLAANMETALNAIWDSGAALGDRIAVVGGGIVGLLTASLLARMPAVEVTLVDIAEERQELAAALGARFALPTNAPRNCDKVFHASVSAAGLETAISCAGFEATIVELSWFGEQPVSVMLGGAFHSQRLRLISSQVGNIAPSHRPRWDYARRMATALRLLEDERLDALVRETMAFGEAPQLLPVLLAADGRNLAPVIAYGSS